jgi:hypothetical protein
MVRSQGKYFSKDELDRIVMLLRETEMTIPEIATRLRCSRSAVAAVNRKFQVRLYGGKRSQWTLDGASRSESSGSSYRATEVTVTES